MALRYALLAALHETPATGYDLTQRFRTRLAHVWNASHQQIYRELGKLHQEGMLTMEAQPQADKPDRKFYRVTAAGEADLRNWLAAPQPQPAVRDPFLVKLFAGDLLDVSAMQQEISQLREQWHGWLQSYRDIEEAFFKEPRELPRHFRLQYLALRRGVLVTQAKLAWLDELDQQFRHEGPRG